LKTEKVKFLTSLPQVVLKDMKKSFEGAHWDAKKLLRFTCLTMKFPNCHHTKLLSKIVAVMDFHGEAGEISRFLSSSDYFQKIFCCLVGPFYWKPLRTGHIFTIFFQNE